MKGGSGFCRGVFSSSPCGRDSSDDKETLRGPSCVFLHSSVCFGRAKWRRPGSHMPGSESRIN